MTPRFFRSHIRRVILSIAVTLACCAGTSSAAEQSASERPQTSARVADELQKVSNLVGEQNKNYDAAIAALEPLLKSVDPTSYDATVISVYLAQMHLMRGKGNDYAASIPYLEHAVNSGYYNRPEDRQRLSDFIFILAQLYNQQKNPDKAEEYAKRYIDMAEKPQPERIMFYCYLLLERAQRSNGQHPELVQQVLDLLDRAMKLSLNPPENLYLFKAIAYQSLEKLDDAAEVFELLVAKYPQKKDYWSQLFAAYVNTGQNLRAALTIERAQKLGFLNTPRENLQLVSLYYNMQQYDKVIELLEKGLHDGSIESDPSNWELLGAALQFTHREFKAIEAYKEAAEKFTDTGKFDATIGTLYWQLEKPKEALHYLERAISRGGIDRPAQTAMFAAFLAFEQKDYKKAQHYLTVAEPKLETDRDKKDFAGLKQSVEEAIKAEEEKAKAEEEKAKGTAPAPGGTGQGQAPSSDQPAPKTDAETTPNPNS